MENSYSVLMICLFPLLGGMIAFFLGKKNKIVRNDWVDIVMFAEWIMLGCAGYMLANGSVMSMTLNNLFGMGLVLEMNMVRLVLCAVVTIAFSVPFMEDVDYDEKLQECKNEEKEFICNAYEGFLAAMEKELFPICGMDESTYMYLVADLARRCKDYENAAKLISQILTSRAASQKVKERTRDLKELIKEELGNK